MSNKEKLPQSEKKKLVAGEEIVLERDYSRGIGIRFDETFPARLNGIVSPQEFSKTIQIINSEFGEAEEANCWTFVEGLLGFFTFYTFFLCSEGRYEKFLRRIEAFRQTQNRDVYEPKGLQWQNPKKHGYMRLVILVTKSE